jgi:hypothetical protein
MSFIYNTSIAHILAVIIHVAPMCVYAKSTIDTTSTSNLRTVMSGRLHASNINKIDSHQQTVDPLVYFPTNDQKVHALVLSGSSHIVSILKSRRSTFNVLMRDMRIVLRVTPDSVPKIYKTIPKAWWTNLTSPFVLPIAQSLNDLPSINLIDSLTGETIMQFEGEQAYSADMWIQLMNRIAQTIPKNTTINSLSTEKPVCAQRICNEKILINTNEIQITGRRTDIPYKSKKQF